VRAGDVRIWIILNSDRTVGSVATWVVCHTSSSLRCGRSLEVLCSFHLLVSFHADVYMLGGTHVSLEGVPVNAGVTDLLESIDLFVNKSYDTASGGEKGHTWKLWGLLHAIPLMVVLPPRARPARMV